MPGHEDKIDNHDNWSELMRNMLELEASQYSGILPKGSISTPFLPTYATYTLRLICILCIPLSMTKTSDMSLRFESTIHLSHTLKKLKWTRILTWSSVGIYLILNKYQPLQLRPLKNRQLSTGISFYWVIISIQWEVISLEGCLFFNGLNCNCIPGWGIPRSNFKMKSPSSTKVPLLRV